MSELEVKEPPITKNPFDPRIRKLVENPQYIEEISPGKYKIPYGYAKQHMMSNKHKKRIARQQKRADNILRQEMKRGKQDG